MSCRSLYAIIIRHFAHISLHLAYAFATINIGCYHVTPPPHLRHIMQYGHAVIFAVVICLRLLFAAYLRRHIRRCRHTMSRHTYAATCAATMLRYVTMTHSTAINALMSTGYYAFYERRHVIVTQYAIAPVTP